MTTLAAVAAASADATVGSLQGPSVGSPLSVLSPCTMAGRQERPGAPGGQQGAPATQKLLARSTVPGAAWLPDCLPEAPYTGWGRGAGPGGVAAAYRQGSEQGWVGRPGALPHLALSWAPANALLVEAQAIEPAIVALAPGPCWEGEGWGRSAVWRETEGVMVALIQRSADLVPASGGWRRPPHAHFSCSPPRDPGHSSSPLLGSWLQGCGRHATQDTHDAARGPSQPGPRAALGCTAAATAARAPGQAGVRHGYRLTHWNALRAFFRPGFLRSTMRESRVSRPAKEGQISRRPRGEGMHP